jgi:hypothetical protein
LELDVLFFGDVENVGKGDGVGAEVGDLDVVLGCVGCVVEEDAAADEALFCPWLEAVYCCSTGGVDVGLCSSATVSEHVLCNSWS